MHHRARAAGEYLRRLISIFAVFGKIARSGIGYGLAGGGSSGEVPGAAHRRLQCLEGALVVVDDPDQIRRGSEAALASDAWDLAVLATYLAVLVRREQAHLPSAGELQVNRGMSLLDQAWILI
eukprot:7376578-Prymnesium_polylepis.1